MFVCAERRLHVARNKVSWAMVGGLKDESRISKVVGLDCVTDDGVWVWMKGDLGVRLWKRLRRVVSLCEWRIVDSAESCGDMR